MKMDKMYSDANGGEGVAPISGGESSMGSQWEIGLDRDEFQSILKSTLGNTGLEITTRYGKFDHNGEISLEEEVDSLEIGRLSIQDEELEEMRKQQQASAVTTLAEGQCASDQPKEKASPGQDKNTESSHLSCTQGVAPSADDVLNDIASVIASSLSPADDHLVSDLEDCDGLSVANVQSVNRFNTELVERKDMMQKAYFSSARDSCHSSPRSDGYSPVGHGSSEQMSSPSSVTHHRVVSPSAPNISSRKGYGPLEDGQRKPLAVFTTSDTNVSQVAKVMTISPEGNSRKVAMGDVTAQHVLDDVCSPVSEGNRHSTSISSGKQDAAEDKSTLSESDSYCQMCPLEYTADDEDGFVDFDENCISGELIPHGRGSSRGRPKMVRPPKGNIIQREIRPKPVPSSLISVTLKEPPGKNCPEVCPVVTAETSHGACLPAGIPSVVRDILGQPCDSNIIRPEQSRSLSMDFMEGDGPVNYITQSHHSGQGQILASNILPHIQGYPVTQQAPQAQPVTNCVLRHQPMQQVNFPQRVREVYCREEPQYVPHKQPVYPSSVVVSHGTMHVHDHVDKNGASGYHNGSSPYNQVPITAYSEVRPDSSGTGATYIRVDRHEGSDLVLASRKDLERAGIPFIPRVNVVASHPQVPPGVHTLTESNNSQKHYTSNTPFQINPAEQSYLQQVGQVYHGVGVRNQPPTQFLDPSQYSQLSRPRQVVQYQGQPQNDKPATYYISSNVSPNINLHSNSLNVPSGSQLAHPVPAQPRHMALITSNMSSEDRSKLQTVTLRDASVMSPSGSVRLSHGSSTSINSRLDGREMPKEDTYSRTEAWIRESSKGASHHTHPIDVRNIPVSVVNSNIMYVRLPGHDIAPTEGGDMAGIKRPANSKMGQGSAKEASKYKAGAGAKIRQSKEKKVDTNNSHQDYLRQLPGKSDDIIKGHLLHQFSQNELASSRDIANIISKDFFGLQRQSQSEMETKSEKIKSSSDACAEADTEIEKIILEKFKHSGQNFSPILNESHPDSQCPVNRDQQLERNPASQTYHIDQSQYLNVEDKESLEKREKQQNNSLDRYLMPDNNSSDPMCELNIERVLTASQVGTQSSPQRDFQVSLQPPTEMAKINITAWAQQSDAITQMAPPVSSSGHANHPFDLANPNATDFPLMLQSLTSSEDENMKSASLGHCGTTDGQKLKFPHANDCHFPNTKLVNNLKTCTASNISMINAKTVPPRTGEQCFQRPVQPAVIQPPQVSQHQELKNNATWSHQACLSACISHPQPLITSAIASLQSQPMSSLRGDSDASMQSDLSRRDRSMNSVTCISGGQTQNQELYNMSSNVLEPLSVKQPSRSKHKTNNVAQWLETQAPYLNQQEKQSPDCQNMHQASLKMHTAVPSHSPQTVKQIDQQDLIPVRTQQQQLLQQHHVLQSILPPSSPSHDQYRNMSFQGLHSDGHFQGLAEDQEEAGFDSFVVPGFSDLLPRCGGSCKPATSTSHGSSVSQHQEATKPSQKQTVSNVSRGVPKEKSPPITHTTCNKQSLKSQKNNKSICHSSSSTTLSSPTVPSSSSKIPQIASSNITVHDTLTNNDSRTQMSSSRTSTVVTSCQVKPSLSNVYYNSKETKASHTASSSSDKNDDLIIVGEKMKTTVNISHGYSSPNQCQKADPNNGIKEKEEEEDDEEEEVSFSGSDVFRPDDQGETILHCLCDIPGNHLEDLASAPGFLEALNISNKAQETPLFVGVHNGRRDVATFLIKQGADTSVSCISPANAFRGEALLQSVLHEAAELGDVKTLNALLKSDTADIDFPRPSSGQTPLMVALHVHSFAQRNPSANRSKVIKFLLTQDASMSIHDLIDGKTPFMYAVLSRDVEIVKRFLSVMDADEARQAVTAKTNRSVTCLHFAASLSKFDRSQKVELIRLLILAGADASVKNAEGESPRDWAHDEMTEVFKKLAPPK